MPAADGRYATLLTVPLKAAGMELERDLVVQVGITVAVVAVFVLALAALSSVYGSDKPARDHSLNGTIDGNYEGNVTEGEIIFDGTFDNSVEMMVDGSINGTVENGTLDGTFEGDTSGAIDGTLTGTVTDAELDQEQRSLSGEFEGTANGTTANVLSAEGGLALIGLMAAFVIAMPAFGYLIQRLKSDEEE
jgi:hypothetical protein